MVVGLMWARVCSVTCALNVFPDRFPEYIIILTILTGAVCKLAVCFYNAIIIYAHTAVNYIKFRRWNEEDARVKIHARI